MASKDKAKNLIRKPDTQKKSNLTPREAKSPNWCPDLHHKASKKAQHHPTEAQIGPTRLPKAPKKPPKTPKKPPSGPTEVQMGATWLPKVLPRNPKRHPKWAQAWKMRPRGNNNAKLHYSHEEITFFSPKTSKTLAFCPPAEGHFWRVLWKSSKTLVFNAFLPSEMGPNPLNLA